jgi:hypothetical protein
MSATPPWQLEPWRTSDGRAAQYRAAADQVLADKLKTAPAWQHARIRADVAEDVKALCGDLRAGGGKYVPDIAGKYAELTRTWRADAGSRDIAAALDGRDAAWRAEQEKAREHARANPVRRRDSIEAAYVEAHRSAVMLEHGREDTPENRARWGELAAAELQAMRKHVADGRDASATARRARHFFALANDPDVALPEDVERLAGGAVPTPDDWKS